MKYTSAEANKLLKKLNDEHATLLDKETRSRDFRAAIEDIEAAIQSMMDEIQSPITTIPGIGVRMGAMILAEIGVTSPVSTRRIRSLRMPECPHLLTSPGSFLCLTPTRTWKSEAPDIYATLFTMQPNTFAFGIRPSPLILPRSGPRASTTMLRSLTRQRNWFD